MHGGVSVSDLRWNDRQTLLGTSAEWLDRQHSHDVGAPEAVMGALAKFVDGAWLPELAVLYTPMYDLPVPIRSTGHGEYVTVNDIGAAMCRQFLGFDPGASRLIGDAWRLRVLLLRQAVTGR